MRFERLGWVVAAALAGGMVGMGFHEPTEKTGSVDMVKVFQDSDMAKKQKDTLQNMLQLRIGVMQFLQQNMHMKSEDAKRFRDLSVKEEPTAADKTEIDRIKADAQANETAFAALNQKASPSPTEIAQMEDLNKRSEANHQLLTDWNTAFNHDLDTKRLSLQDDAMARVKDAVQAVGKKQGYSIVFSQETAPYTANDLTADALNQINSNKK